MIHKTRLLPPLCILACRLLVSAGEDARGTWAASEIVWPWEKAAKVWESHALYAGTGQANESWPKRLGDLCAESERDATGKGADDGDVLVELRRVCDERLGFRPASAEVDAGAYPFLRDRSFSRPFEAFAPHWFAERVDPEIAGAWFNLTPAVRTELKYPISEGSLIYFRLSLRRDLAAWNLDPVGGNWPAGPSEVDINEPSLGYFHIEGQSFAMTVGRFPVHWSPSPDFGLTLSRSVPFFDGAEFAFKMPHARYRFLVAGLNPWLQGTPPGDTSSRDYPIGSEAYRQSHYPAIGVALNAHNRVFDAPVKTLLVHRLEGEVGRAALGITEIQMVGGKVPDLRDADPFVFFHNNFSSGYLNLSLGLDATLRLPLGLLAGAELYLDDVSYAPTEGHGGSPSLLGYLVFLRQSFRARGWAYSHSLHLIRTDPFLYGFLQPLNTMASRQVLTSNFYGPGGANIVDKYVVDFPVGYFRGGDALDFWYRVEARRRGMVISLELARLAKGEVDLYTPYQYQEASSHDSPTGTAERETRLRPQIQYNLVHGFSVKLGGALRALQNAGHRAGAEETLVEAEAGVTWDWSK